MSAVRVSGGTSRPRVEFRVDGAPVRAPDGECLAVALACADILCLRRSPTGEGPRGAFCFMGTCQDCVVRVDGVLRQACLIAVRAGMDVALRGSL